MTLVPAAEVRDFELLLKASEYPFVRPGISKEEFSKEYLYYKDHLENRKMKEYKPLWKQNNKSD